MSDDRRSVLKQLLSGSLTGKEAVAKLNITNDNQITLIIGTSDGLFNVRGESRLTKEEVYARTKGEYCLRVGEDQHELISTMYRLYDEH